MEADRTKVLVSDVLQSHADWCAGIIEAVDSRLTTETILADNLDDDVSSVDSVRYALENGFAIVSRSTSGISDGDYDEGQSLLDNGRIGVHSNGLNTNTETADIGTPCPMAVARFTSGDYNNVTEFTFTNQTSNSASTAYLAGWFGKFGLDHPTLSYSQIRQAMRDTASNGGVWQEVTGYGTPDWDACELALQALES